MAARFGQEFQIQHGVDFSNIRFLNVIISEAVVEPLHFGTFTSLFFPKRALLLTQQVYTIGTNNMKCMRLGNQPRTGVHTRNPKP